jgi:hypothetical protein
MQYHLEVTTQGQEQIPDLLKLVGYCQFPKRVRLTTATLPRKEPILFGRGWHECSGFFHAHPLSIACFDRIRRLATKTGASLFH